MRTEISKDAKLLPGDIIEIEFITRGLTYLRAVQMAIIENKLNNEPNYDVLSWRLEDGDKRVIYKIRIIDPAPSVEIQKASTAAAIAWAVVAVGGGLFIWLSLDKVYKITESPEGKMALTAAAAIIGLIILKLFE